MPSSALSPLVRVAARNVWKNWRHSIGTVLAIAVGFLTIGLFEGYLQDLFERQSYILSRRNMMGDVMIEHRDAGLPEADEDPLRFSLTKADQAAIESYLAQDTSVVTRVRILDISGLASTGRSGVMFMSLGHDVAEGATMRGEFAWNAVAGKPLHEAGRDAVVLAQGLGGILECEATSDEPVTDPLGVPIPKERPMKCKKDRVQFSAMTASGQINAIELPVSGIYNAVMKELDARFSLMPLSASQRLLDTDVISLVSVRLAPGASADAWAKRFNGAVSPARKDVIAVPWDEHRFAELHRRGRQILQIYRSFVVVVVSAIAGMSVLMTMMKTVSERTREVGTLRSLGFRRRHIIGLFALEAGFLAVFAASLGAAASLALTFAVNAAQITYKAGVLSDSIPLIVAVSPTAYVFAASFLCGVAMLAALAPAWHASRLAIPEALGHV